MVSFGLVNQEAQKKATIGESSELAYFSNATNIFKTRLYDSAYATLEEDFTKADGTMLFPPRQNSVGIYYDTGITSKELVSDTAFTLSVNLNVLAMDFKGLTIDFGENYPVDFDLVSSGGQRFEYRGNTESVFTTEDVLEDTTQVILVVYAMKNPQSRVRIYSIRFGYGLVYYNDDVTASSLTSYVSPIGADVPQIDFSVTLNNYNHYFNVDNPKSAINFLETGQEMEIHYGYELPETGEIEWVQGNHLLCSEWESDDYTATIRCQDIFRNMDSEFFRGIYRSEGVSYYDLATEVLTDADITGYYLDPQLKRLFTKNPLPRVPHKEALQIIANACRCVLTQTRTGKVQIKSSFVPELTASTDTQTDYSNVHNILGASTKDEYGAGFEPNYRTVSGGVFFIPRDGEYSRNTGFVSSVVSDENGLFVNDKPLITLTQEVVCAWHGARFIFGNALPAAFTLRTYNNSELVFEREVGADEIERVTLLYDEFDDFDTMTIEFTATAEPYNRIVLNNFAFGDITDFTMTRIDMTSSPKAIKQELVKEVIVPCYSYQNGIEEESLVGEDVIVAEGEERTFYLGDACHDYRAVLGEETEGVSIIDNGNYYLTVRFNIEGEYRLEVFGYRYKIVEQYATRLLNNRGKTIKWENPLISDMEMANDLADWLRDYYEGGVEYEYNTRGNPELDVNDIIYQENEFHEGMKVKVYRQTLEFNQSFAGSITARRMEA